MTEETLDGMDVEVHPAADFGPRVFCEFGLSPRSATLLGLALCSGDDFLHTYLVEDWADRQKQSDLLSRIETLTDCTYVNCYGIDDTDLIGKHTDDDEHQSGLLETVDGTILFDNAEELEFEDLYEPMTKQRYTGFEDGERIHFPTECTVLAVTPLEERAETHSSHAELLPVGQRDASLFNLLILPNIGPDECPALEPLDLQLAAECVREANTYDPAVTDDMRALIGEIEDKADRDVVDRRHADLTMLSRAAARLRGSNSVVETDVTLVSRLLFDTEVVVEQEVTPAALVSGTGLSRRNRHQFTLQVIDTLENNHDFGVPFDDLATVMGEYKIDEEQLETTLDRLRDKGDILKIRDKKYITTF